ncbi:MAG: NAD(P)-dependent alcohol dehydrogenase [Steroidobacteraceae bacterium]|nr:NAD(P)-dependent alcohol dehydrogenase [Steroidobacteraceae bacterium]
MSLETRAWVQREADADPRLESLRLDDPRPDEVVVRIVATGVCHTDLMGPALGWLPAVYGHEGAGIVERVGARVAKVRPGDRVALTFGSCGTCANCHEGHPSHCANSGPLQFGGARLDGSATFLAAPGTPPVRGAFFQQSSFATFALATERNVVRVPDEFPLELAGPLGCGIQTGAGAVLNTLAVPAGARFAVFGVGSVGLSAVMAAKLAGCLQVVAVDVDPARLALARELGATHALDAREGGVVERIVALTRGGATHSLETAGAEDSFRAAIECLAKRGVCGLATVPHHGRPFAYSPLPILMGRTVVGVLEGSSVPDTFIPRLMELQLAGRLPYERLVRWYGFDDLPRALEDARTGRAIKPIVRIA